MNPNAYDAAFAAAGLGNRIQCASVNTLTRISLAAMEVAQLEAEDAIPEGDYEWLIDRLAERLSDPRWPAPGIRIGLAVRDVLAGMEGQP
jgi:hypothetical protein